MNNPLSRTPRILLPVISLGVVCFSSGSVHADNPINRLARLIDSDLVEVENRILWLDSMLKTLAKPNIHPLKTGLGYRGGRLSDDAPPPSITLDLGKIHSISNIYLIPSQQEFLGDPGIFPRRLTLECSVDPDFRESIQIHQTQEDTEESSNSSPNKYPVSADARYVRLTVNQGLLRDGMEIFGLSEFLVTSGDFPVSFGAKVTTAHPTQTEGLWFPEALIDGRSPLGIWESGNPTVISKGDVVSSEQQNSDVSWSVSFNQEITVDHMVFFPYEINRAFGTYVMPESVEIEIDVMEGPHRLIIWNNPSPGGSHLTPLVIPLHGLQAQGIQIRASKPWLMGNQHVCAFSEIEIWSGNANVVSGQTFLRSYRNKTEPVDSLSDGFTSSQKILPAGAWLDQLQKRHAAEQEVANLRPIYQSLEDRSELNASWGASVIIGLACLTPLVIVERRRLTSRKNLNQLRSRIASDLHDDIGSNLGSISMIARAARKNLAKLDAPTEIDHDLEEVEAIARESALAMRDIVWLLERKQDSVGDLYHRMQETANRLLRDIEFEMDCRSTQTGAKLSLDAKRHLFLFYKESIHNILKHSKASKVQIGIRDDGDHLVVEVTDNGIGLPSDTDDKHTSVSKLEERCRMLRGQLDISSSPNSGTSLRLRVKRSSLASV